MSLLLLFPDLGTPSAAEFIYAKIEGNSKTPSNIVGTSPTNLSIVGKAPTPINIVGTAGA